MPFLQKATRPVRRTARHVLARIRHRLQWFDSDEKLESESQQFWSRPEGKSFASNSHWRGHGPFSDDDVWLTIGEMHRQLFFRAAEWAGMQPTNLRIVEWGCGGGMNAVQFAPESKEYFGVDVSGDSLNECARQVEGMGYDCFRPIQIRADDPEAAVKAIDGKCDAFVCTYVFELLPTHSYCQRIVRIAADLVRPGGIALIQIRYPGGTVMSRSRQWNYSRNMPHMVSIGIADFWQEAEQFGFEPIFVRLLPRQPELAEERYAYFALRRS